MAEMTASESRPTRNLLLNGLPVAELSALNPLLCATNFKPLDYLINVNARIQDIYFLESGLASVIGVAAENRMVNVGLIGREGIVGATALLGVKNAPHDCCMQTEGSGYRIALDDLVALSDRTPVLHATLLRFVHILLIQSAETVICNGIPAIEPRLARCLLMCHDRLDCDILRITHENLALMLGVRRAGVTVALHVLEGEKMIRSLRGQIVILDRGKLERATRGCYGLAEAEYARIFSQPTGFKRSSAMAEARSFM